MKPMRKRELSWIQRTLSDGTAGLRHEKSMKPESDPEAAETVQTTNDPAVAPSTSCCASSGSRLRWHMLTAISRDGEGFVEVLAATCIDGIGVIVRWEKEADGWDARSMDTESGTWDYVEFYEEGNEIPVEPPTEWDDLSQHNDQVRSGEVLTVTPCSESPLSNPVK